MTQRAPGSSRDLALDVTKGVLVVLMVVYHALNYSTERHLGFAYLSFLPPSFILIAGFLLSSSYLTRYNPREPQLWLRLFSRGAKLLLIFIVLNVAGIALVKSRARGEMPELAMFVDQWFEVFITGNARLATFEILLPIAYLLFCAPLLLLTQSVNRFALPVLTIMVVAALAFLEKSGLDWANLLLLSAGLVGMLLGCIPTERIRGLVRFRWILLIAYAGSYWVADLLGHRYPMQIVAAATALAAIYAWCGAWIRGAWISRRLELLGQYSLLAYIAQIALLVILSRAIGSADPLSGPFLGLFSSALGLTAVTVELAAWLRTRIKAADIAYKTVFA